MIDYLVLFHSMFRAGFGMETALVALDGDFGRDLDRRILYNQTWYSSGEFGRVCIVWFGIILVPLLSHQQYAEGGARGLLLLHRSQFCSP